MTSYFTAVANELLPDVRSGERLPSTLHLRREIGPIHFPSRGMTLVEFEDDEAPAELSGRTITPTIRAHYDERGIQTHTTIVDRSLDLTDYRTAGSGKVA